VKQKQTAMTTQDLKDNRNEIINFINSRNYDLKFAMQMAVELAVNCDSLDELFSELEQHCKPVKSSKLADMMANAHQDERYNHNTKTWEKI
jgi:S-methylmethionine-dependent homocysteine/selenocysteine methylase